MSTWAPDLKLRPGALPGNLYELYASSVPDSLLTIMAAGRNDALFAALSAPIEQSLARYLRNPEVISQGGSLVIQANGEIDYETRVKLAAFLWLLVVLDERGCGTCIRLAGNMAIRYHPRADGHG